MTQRSYFWNGLAVGDANLSPYDSDVLALIERLKFQPNPERQSVLGFNPAALDGLLVSAGGGDWSEIAISSGSAMVNGRLYNNTATVTLKMTLNVGSWWAVVLRSDTATQTIRLALKGPYLTESAALSSPAQNADVWEVVLATVLQGAVSPSCYDQRIRTIRNSTVYRLIPVAGGFDNTTNDYIDGTSSMGLGMPNNHASRVLGTFTIDYDMWSDVTIEPVLIPLGTDGNVYISVYYEWGQIGELHDVHSYSTAYSAHAVVNQVINLETGYVFSPKPVPKNGIVSCTFYRDATDPLDTFNGTLYCPGWRVEYDSYTR